MTDTLILVSNSYPFRGVTEASFIAPEIEYLSERFKRIVILPLSADGVPDRLPGNVEVDTTLCIRPSLWNKVSSLLNPSLLRMASYDFFRSWKVRDFARSLSQSCYVMFFRRLVQHVIVQKGIDLRHSLFYTFWFDFSTAAISCINGTKIVTRAHGYDIFEERGHISRSWRNFTLRNIDACFSASEYGEHYMQRIYSDSADKITTRFLGSESPLALNPPTKDDAIHLYGCARLSEEKGVVRQFEFLTRFAATHPELHIIYTHIGDGPLMESLRRIAHGSPANIDFILKGALPNCEVHKFLSASHQDFMILLSHTEGMPISICEALSYGIPVLATSVGGITDLPQDCGIFLTPDCKFEEFNLCMLSALKNKTAMRGKARQVWEQNFDSRKLRAAFAEEISRL